MPRNLTADMLAALRSKSWAPVIFVEADCLSGPARCWSGRGSIVWNGVTWKGVGGLIAVEFPQETAEIQADNSSVTLSGIDPLQIELALNECRQGNAVTKWLGAMASDGSILDSPVIAAAENMDIPTIEDGAETSSIKLSCESLYLDLHTPRTRQYTHNDQQLDHPGDNGFIFVQPSQDFNRKW